MAGQTNSWIGNVNISPIPCIGDTVRKVSSSNEYGLNAIGETVQTSEPVQSASLWWLIGIGLVVGLMFKKSKRYESQY